MASIKKLFVNIGAFSNSQFINNFFTKNRSALANMGIIYPDFADFCDLPGQHAAFTLINKFKESPDALNKYLNPLFNLQKNLSHSHEYSEISLVLSAPSLYRYSEILTQLEKKFSEIYPSAQIHYFASFSPQYLEVSALASLVTLFYGKPLQDSLNMYLLNPKPLNYLAALNELRKNMPRANFTFHITRENADSPLSLGREALASFLNLLGLNESNRELNLDFSPPAWMLSDLSQEGATLISLINAFAQESQDDKANPNKTLPWESQLPRMMAGANHLSPLIDDNIRQRLHDAYKATNETFCGKLGQKSFAYPASVGISPSGFDRIAARKLTESLENGFGVNLLKTIKEIERPDRHELIFLREALETPASLTVTSSHDPSLDVLTLACNQEKYIAECINSVLSQQTSFPVRHIIVDDVSNDGTPDIIAQYARDYPDRIIPVFLKRKHIGDNIKTAFSLCNARYAALCDGDDYFISPFKLQKQVDFLEAHADCAICFHPVEKRYEDGSPTALYPPASMLPGNGSRRIFSIHDLFTGNFIQTNSVVYRWRFQEGLPNWFDPTLTPSDWYWHLLHAETGMIGYLPQPMSVYRRHAASLFAVSEKSHVDHRARFGIPELRLYSTLDRHFKGLYNKELQTLANGVFADYVKIYMEAEDDSLLRKAIREYPGFARKFLSDLKAL